MKHTTLLFLLALLLFAGDATPQSATAQSVRRHQPGLIVKPPPVAGTAHQQTLYLPPPSAIPPLPPLSIYTVGPILVGGLVL